MAYDDTASRRSHGGRSHRTYDDDYDRYDDRYDDRRDRRSYYNDPPPADNSLARRQDLPAAYYRDDPSVRSGRSRRDRSRSRSGSRTPPRRSGTGPTRKGDILSAVGGALIATAADKFLVEPRQNKHRRSKSHNETWRRVADVGVGGAAGTAIYRAVSRSRARKKGALADSRPGSPDSRARSDSRGRSESRGGSPDKKRSRSKSIPWKTMLSTAAGGIAGLAAEQIKKRSDSQKADRSRARYSDDSSDDDRSRRGGSRRHRSADDDRRSRRRDYSDDDSDYDRRDRKKSRDPKKARDPHEARDMILKRKPFLTFSVVKLQEAIGLIGAAQGIQGKHKGRAAMETAVGAAGLAHKYYTQHKARHPSMGPPPR